MRFPKLMRAGTGNKKFFLYGLKVIRTPGQQQKSDVPRGARGWMGAEQFDRRISHICSKYIAQTNNHLEEKS